MKKKIILTILLFIFSFLYLKNAVYWVRENDNLMKEIRRKASVYNEDPVNAIITKSTMIPGKKGKKVDLEKSYKKMKAVNSFQESLIVYDQLLPEVSIKNTYDKVLISGNIMNNKISVLTELNDDYCYTENLTINKKCILNHKYTILIHKITNNHLTKVRELVKNGIIFYLETNDNEVELIKKYLKNNNYEIVELQELIKE